MFNSDQAAHYLGAMIDGEGWIGEPRIDPRRGGFQNRAVRIANTDPGLIDAIIECCEVLGIHYTRQHIKRRRPGDRPSWVVDITGLESLQTIRDQVPIRAIRKRERLQRTIDTFRKPLDKEEILRLYSGNRTQKQVAEQMGVSIKRLSSAMKRYGIPVRSQKEQHDLIWQSRRARFGPAGRPPKVG